MRVSLMIRIANDAECQELKLKFTLFQWLLHWRPSDLGRHMGRTWGQSEDGSHGGGKFQTGVHYPVRPACYLGATTTPFFRPIIDSCLIHEVWAKFSFVYQNILINCLSGWLKICDFILSKQSLNHFVLCTKIDYMRFLVMVSMGIIFHAFLHFQDDIAKCCLAIGLTGAGLIHPQMQKIWIENLPSLLQDFSN